MTYSIVAALSRTTPDGQMRREKLLNMYVNVLSNAKAKTFVNQIFSKYDTDNSGSIDFKVTFWMLGCYHKGLNFYIYKQLQVQVKLQVHSPVFSNIENPDENHVNSIKSTTQEFMMATTMTGDVTDKLRLAFRIYDEDGSGTVDRGEMVEIVSNMYTQQGVAMVGAVSLLLSL